MKIYSKVKSNSKEEKVERISGNEYLICVKAPAREGKANKSVRKLIAKEFKVDMQKVIIKNPKSKSKIIEIQN